MGVQCIMRNTIVLFLLAPLCRLPVMAEICVLGRKDIIVMGNLQTAFSRN